MNVDEEDIAKHGSIKDWWDTNGPMMGLHAMNSLRISLIREGLERSGKLEHAIKSDAEYLNGLKIIDVGCGGGILCEPLAKLGAEVVGVDASDEVISIARKHANSNKSFKIPPMYITSTIEEHSASHIDEYDALIASEIIEHVPDKQRFLDACVKTLKPIGSLFLTTPNRTFMSWIGNILIAENVLKLLPKGIHDWNKFVTPTELQCMLSKCGCNTVVVKGMIFNVLKRNWRWTFMTHMHYAMHAIKAHSFKNIV